MLSPFYLQIYGYSYSFNVQICNKDNFKAPTHIEKLVPIK